MSGAQEQQLERTLGLRHVFAVAAGAMFSSGFFLLPGLAFAEVGPALPLAYLAAGLVALPALLAVAELSTAMPAAGGPYVFVQRALGPVAGVAAGIGIWVVLVLKAAFALEGIGTYLALLADLPVTRVAVVAALALTAVNLRGAEESSRLQVVLVAALIGVLGVVIASGLGRTGTALRDGQTFEPLLPAGVGGLLAGVALVFVSYAGLTQSTSLAQETRRPERNLPLGMGLALAVATAVYVVGSAVLVAVLDHGELAAASAPVATGADELLGRFGVWMVVVAAAAAFVSTGNAGILAGSRYPFALARDGEVWERLGRTSGGGVPRLAVGVTGVAVLASVVVLDVEELAHLASAFVLVVFALLQISVVVLRRRRSHRPDFRMPLVPVLPVLGVLASSVLLVELGAGPALFCATVLGAGAGWRVLHRRLARTG